MKISSWIRVGLLFALMAFILCLPGGIVLAIEAALITFAGWSTCIGAGALAGWAGTTW
jgi:hypothetical protein